MRDAGWVVAGVGAVLGNARVVSPPHRVAVQPHLVDRLAGPRLPRQRDKARSELEVGLDGVEDGDGRVVVSAAPTDLLVVAVERVGGLGVEDPAHPGLVDAHAERVRRHDDAAATRHEGRLYARALLARQPRVVRFADEPTGRESVPHPCHRATGGRVDDRRTPLRLGEDPRTADLPSLNINVVDGTVVVRGAVPDSADQDAIRDVITGVEGVQNVDMKLGSSI